ncbi:hypothetical protein F4814DRAFT_408662 [Daldinia grandis]|nr:hypothetical protein F4814DRAFT_408662 [Daldinia grandis]
MERRDRESTDRTRGRTEVGSPKQGTNNDNGRQFPEAIVIDSEEDSSDECGTEQPLIIPGSSPSKRPRISDVEGLNVNSNSSQRNRKRQRVELENSSEGGECSNTARLRESQSEAEATTPIVDLPPMIPRKHNGKKRENKIAYKGVIDPIVGGIYKIHQGLRKGSYAAVILPIGDFGAIGISESLYDTSLRRSIPSCYIYNKTIKEILGWEKDYDDDGPRVKDRKFPVMSFDGIARDQIPLDGEFCPTGAKYSWVPARSIRTLEFDAIISRMTLGYTSAKRFITRLDLIKENMIKETQRVHDYNEPPHITSEALSPGETRRQDPKSSQTQGHSQELTLRYSEADLTPRQSQTIEGHSNTIRSTTEPRPNSRSQGIGHIFHTFEAIYRETSEPELVGSETSSDGVHNDNDRDHQLVSDLFPDSPIAHIRETFDGNIASDVRHSDPVKPSTAHAKALPTSGLPYVARAIRRPWSEDSSLDPGNQNATSSLGSVPASSKPVRTLCTNPRRYVNPDENGMPDYLPPAAEIPPRGPSPDHQTTAGLQGNGARNGERALPPNPNIQSTASTALSYFNTIYCREK